MRDIQTKGWLPIDIDFDAAPSVVTDAQVRWIETGDTPLAEPFFGQTVETLRAAVPPPMELDTRLDRMLQIASRVPTIRPNGLIFHVSHCGSTLVANILKSARDTVVAAEAPPFGRLARLYPEPPHPYLKDRWECSRRALLEALSTLFVHYRTGQPERLVIKFQSLNLLSMRQVRAIWPQTPCVVLVRDPVEVLVSAVAEQGWLAWKPDPAAARVSFAMPDLPDSLHEISDAEFCARVLGQHLKAALESVDTNCKVIDYEDLNPKRLRDIAEFFGLELPPDKKRHETVLSVYSKDSTKVVPFKDDRLRKQMLASTEVRSAAYRWAMPAYSELRGLGFW